MQAGLGLKSFQLQLCLKSYFNFFSRVTFFCQPIILFNKRFIFDSILATGCSPGCAELNPVSGVFVS